MQGLLELGLILILSDKVSKFDLPAVSLENFFGFYMDFLSLRRGHDDRVVGR
jgi:hypothetical protein